MEYTITKTDTTVALHLPFLYIWCDTRSGRIHTMNAADVPAVVFGTSPIHKRTLVRYAAQKYFDTWGWTMPMPNEFLDAEGYEDTAAYEAAARVYRKKSTQRVTKGSAANAVVHPVCKWLDEVEAALGEEHMAFLKAQYATFGTVHYYNAGDLLENASVKTMGLDPEYLVSDYTTYRWLRYTIESGYHSERRSITDAHRESRVFRRACLTVSGGITARELHATAQRIRDGLPIWRLETRADWLASSYPALTRALQTASAADMRWVRAEYRKLGRPTRGLVQLRRMLSWLEDAGRHEDGPGEHTTIRNWFRASERRHRENEQRRRENEAARLAQWDGFVGPEIAGLPEEFVQIRTARTCNDEGHDLNHCVWSYGPDVARGAAFVVAYRPDGATDAAKRATAQLMFAPTGELTEIRQCYGIGNTRNAPARDAEKLLRTAKAQIRLVPDTYVVPEGYGDPEGYGALEPQDAFVGLNVLDGWDVF